MTIKFEKKLNFEFLFKWLKSVLQTEFVKLCTVSLVRFEFRLTLFCVRKDLAFKSSEVAKMVFCLHLVQSIVGVESHNLS